METAKPKGSLMGSVTGSVKEFFRFDASVGILLIIATMLAMVIENSPARVYYDALLDVTVAIQIGDFEIAKALLYWINDGLMALFFFLVGLEIKREILDGELSDPSRVVLPVIAALGGMLVPAAVYMAINWGDEIAMQGWAISSATDIAFALGVLALLGTRVPSSLKLFLMTLAIIDDVGAIIIIAIFYTSNLSLLSFAAAGVILLALFVLNRCKVISLAPYLFLSMLLWAAVLKSGIHATLAGVLAAMFIPYRTPEGDHETQLERLEEDLHPFVSFAILPLFAFANTGISFSGLGIDALLDSIPLGIAMGLFLGNQLGVMSFCWIGIKLGLGSLPERATWLHLWGVSMLCGIGFTMSLFVAGLAFESESGSAVANPRLGILVGSLLSAVFGYLVLRYGTTPAESEAESRAKTVAATQEASAGS